MGSVHRVNQDSALNCVSLLGRARLTVRQTLAQQGSWQTTPSICWREHPCTISVEVWVFIYSLVPLAERRFLLVKFRLLPKERSPSQSSGHPCHHLSLWGFDGLILREILWTNSRYRMKPATKSPTFMLAKTKERQNHQAIQFHHSRWNEVASMKLIWWPETHTV